MTKTDVTPAASARPYFVHLRLNCEMPFWKRWVWRLFGKRSVGFDSGYVVIAYTLRNITLVWDIKEW